MAQQHRKKKALDKKTEEILTASKSGFYSYRWAFALGIAILTFFIYINTLCPTVAGGDSGELTSAAHLLGVAHPPGYPTWTLLGKLFTFFPFGDIAWRVNLFTAACGSAASGLILLAVSLLTMNVWAGLFSAGLFAFSPLVWRYSIIAEVFSLNHLFIAGLIYLFVKFHREPEDQKKKTLYLSAFWVGLGLTHHHLFTLYAIPILFLMLWQEREEIFKWRELGILAALGVLGLIPYLYLPWASANLQAVSWGDLTTWDGFWTHFFRKEYGTFQLAINTVTPGEDFNDRLGLYFSQLPGEILYGGLLLAMVGLWTSLKNIRDRALALCLLVIFFLYLFIFCGLSNLRLDVPLHVQIQARFWQQPNLLVCIWAGVGLSSLASLIRKWKEPILASFVVLAISAQIILHYRASDQSKNYLFRDFGKALLSSLPDRAVLITSGDFIVNSLRYLQFSEGFRKDVAVAEENLMAYPWDARILKKYYPDLVIPAPGFYGEFGYNMRAFIEANRNQQSQVFSSNAFQKKWDTSYLDQYDAWQMGFVEQILPKGQAPKLEDWAKKADENLSRFDPTRLEGYAADTWEYQIFIYYRDMRTFLNRRLLGVMSGPEINRKALELVVAGYEYAIRQNPTNPDPNFYKGLGLAYQYLTAFDPSATAGMVRAWKTYLQMAPASDSEIGVIKNKIAQAESSLK